MIAGQGTAALELLTEEPNLDVVCTPVGGGGLIGGTALAAKAMAPQCRVIAAEPEKADDAYRSFREGKRLSVSLPATIADGLRGSIGVLNFALLQSHVDDVVTVTEKEIVNAMRIMLQDLKLLIEPSSAVAVAAAAGREVGKQRSAGRHHHLRRQRRSGTVSVSARGNCDMNDELCDPQRRLSLRGGCIRGRGAREDRR